MKNIINLILAIVTIVTLAIATVFTVVGLASLDSTPYTGLMSVCSGLLLFVGQVYAMTFLNPFTELKKSFDVLVSTSTLWGNRAGVPPIALGNVNMKETEMKQETDAWKKQAERMTEELVQRYEERGLVIEEMSNKINELRGSEMFYCNFARVKSREVNRLKEELLNARRDIVNLKNELREINAEIEGEKRGAVDMIMGLTAQIKALAEENIRLKAERKMALPPKIMGVQNDSINYNDDWKLVHGAEKLIESAKGKAVSHDQAEDIVDLKAKVAVARNYAAGIMHDKYIPSDLKDSIKAIMATINNWLI
jgi:hypothetical protein